MPAASVPTPQYIDYATNVYPLIGRDKVLVENLNFNAIDETTANMLIAAGESITLEDLSPYYVTVPALVTTTNGTWDTLPKQTYEIIYNMFVYQAALQIIGSFIAKNTDEEDRTLSYFQRYYTSEYAKRHNRIVDLLPNGSYKYQLLGLQTLQNEGIPRRPKRYAISGAMGVGSYADSQFTNPERNFDTWWGNGYGYYRRGW